MSVYGLLAVLGKYFKIKNDRANVSNATFTLHKHTATLLLACSILTTARQFYGEPIHCQLDADVISLKIFESYCFMSGTYTLLDNARDNSTLLHHGSIGFALGPEDSRTIHHNYYQWVCLVLVFQAAACYAPWFVWKTAEGGRVNKLLVKVSNDPLTETPVEDQVANLGDFILSHRGWFNATALKLLLCQAFCLLNSLGQLYMMDLFLGRRFFDLASAFNNFEVLRQALRTIFPWVVICSMPVFGGTGGNISKTGICILPNNILNEKIYLVLWFWFLCLTIVSFLQLARQAALLGANLRTCLSPGLASRLTSPRQVRQLVTRGSYGDTVLLQLVAANCDCSQFSALVQHLVREHILEDSYVSQQLSLTKGNRGVQKLVNESFNQDLLSVVTKNV